MVKERQPVSELVIPADRDAQLALVARLLDPGQGGLLKPDDLRDISGTTGVQVRDVMGAPGADTLGAAEVAGENPTLARFESHYDRWSQESKVKCSWEEVQKRLLLNEGQNLKLASALHEGGVMFGVDASGKILFADGGEDVTDIEGTTGLNYQNTRKVVMFRQDDKGGEIPTGYEMFPYVEPYEKSQEILAFEKFTGKPFVKSADGKEWRSSWLASGATPDWPRDALFFPGYQAVFVVIDHPRPGLPDRGVRRLLRV